MARPSSPKLSAPAIAAAALELVDAHGEFTIPHLAKVMGVSPSSLYNHVSSKDDIIEMMRGQAMGEIELPDPDTDWVQALRQIAKGYMRSYSKHPRLIPLLTAHTVRDELTLRVYDLLAEAFARGRFSASDSLAAITVLDSFVLGSALDAAAPSQVWESNEDSSEAWRTALEAGLAVSDRAQTTFEYGLEILLAGFSLQAASVVSVG
ncbi:TetR/AcrR family transcriptional regulator [Paeniglutamicibacter kerguelensis]|uniref:AcrR family transcriptional regulator n=1 Tax=Paeniglutamicibacter kerguelensis TaxID=254788 RepID=A0ABS4X803_9MICC|nr:TetR/AcrR family transcriptional regulator C-terminal domain-containing protein [Paeniglutamicibacter kerguelensis]MBP2384600.1 AcrR family transcriptional regulator [Paeniglutamicibacter kerguelensis]